MKISSSKDQHVFLIGASNTHATINNLQAIENEMDIIGEQLLQNKITIEEYKSAIRSLNIRGLANSDTITAIATRMTIGKHDGLEIVQKSLNNSFNDKLVNNVTNTLHLSTSDHMQFNLLFNNVSALIERYLINYRQVGVSVKSRRYVDFSNAGYYIPDIFLQVEKDLLNKVKEDIENSIQNYSYLMENDIPRQDARYILPMFYHNQILFSADATVIIKLLADMLFGYGSNFSEIKHLGLEIQKEMLKNGFPVFCDENIIKKLVNKQPYQYEQSAYVDNIVPCEVDKETLKVSRFGGNLDIILSTYLMQYGLSNEASIEMLSNEKERLKIINSLIRSRDAEELEMLTYSIYINDITSAVGQHILRHRKNSRFPLRMEVVPQINRFIVPETIKADEKLYNFFCNYYISHRKLYTELKNIGMSKFDLAYMALNCNTYPMQMIWDANSLKNLFGVRCCHRSQGPTRLIANEILQTCRDDIPELFQHMGPNCFMYGCNESEKMKCDIPTGEVFTYYKRLKLD